MSNIPLGNINGFNVFMSVSFSEPETLKLLKIHLKAFLGWRCAQHLFGSQIPVTT